RLCRTDVRSARSLGHHPRVGPQRLGNLDNEDRARHSHCTATRGQDRRRGSADRGSVSTTVRSFLVERLEPLSSNLRRRRVRQFFDDLPKIGYRRGFLSRLFQALAEAEQHGGAGGSLCGSHSSRVFFPGGWFGLPQFLGWSRVDSNLVSTGLLSRGGRCLLGL